MDKLKKLDEVEKTAVIKHRTMLIVEAIMSLVSLGVLIYHFVSGDPDGRVPATLGAVCIFLVPFLVERIFKVRFAPLAHVFFTSFVTLSVFCGSALNFHNTVGPYDEIMHFLLGYMSCIFFFYFIISWKDHHRQSPLFIAFVIFMCSMGISALWEILEFGMDVFLDQTSIGAPSNAIVEQGIALGYSGISLKIYGIMHGVGVWDTITDMCLHLCGNVLFMIEFAIEANVKRRLFLGLIEKDYLINHNAYYELKHTNLEAVAEEDIESDDTAIVIENH